jgi:AraC-like DNA-binding protein
MKIEGLHEKELFEKEFPFRLIVNQDINFNYPAHWHNAIELIYVLENEFVVFVNSKKYVLKEKDIFFIPSGDIHEFQSETPTGTRIFINFELSSLNYYGDADRIRTQLCDVRLITPNDGILYSQIESEVLKVLQEIKDGGSVYQLYYTARVIDILVLLCRNTPSKINIENMENSKGKSWGLNKISKSFEFIEKNYSEDIHLKDFAQAVGFSEFYFSRLFKEITEKSFHQYLNEYRIKKAEILLADSNYTVSEAAYATGFSSITTFDRLFKKMKGCSPQEFRKLHVGH